MTDAPGFVVAGRKEGVAVGRDGGFSHKSPAYDKGRSETVDVKSQLLICGVVVTYYPDPLVYDRVRVALQQVAQVVIVDNGTVGVQSEPIEALRAMDKVCVLKNSHNEGVAAALNEGVKWAVEHGYEWVLTLDQDSRVSPTLIADMWDAYCAFPESGRVAVIAPQYRDPMLQKLISFARGNLRDPYAVVQVTMTSGNLVRAAVWAKVGGYNGELFIDLVDFEFCLRCRRLGYVVLEATRAELEHHLGEPSWHSFGGKMLSVGNYSALRRYYSSRNRIWVYRHYGRGNLDWILRDFLAFGRECIGIVLFERDRLIKFRGIIQGLYHGFIGRLGPRE